MYGIWTQKLKINVGVTLQRRPETTFGLVSVILFDLVMLKKQLGKKNKRKQNIFLQEIVIFLLKRCFD